MIMSSGEMSKDGSIMSEMNILTIEVAVKDKPDNHVTFHQKIHCNVVCPCWNWDELKYVTNSREPEYKGQPYRDQDLY